MKSVAAEVHYLICAMDRTLGHFFHCFLKYNTSSYMRSFKVRNSLGKCTLIPQVTRFGLGCVLGGKELVAVAIDGCSNNCY
jgi:hypothetical protein